MINTSKKQIIRYLFWLLILLMPIIFTLIMRYFIQSDYIADVGSGCEPSPVSKFNPLGSDICYGAVVGVDLDARHSLWFTRHIFINMIIWYALVAVLVIIRTLIKRLRKIKK